MTTEPTTEAVGPVLESTGPAPTEHETEVERDLTRSREMDHLRAEIARQRKPRGRIAFWIAIGWVALILFAGVFADALPVHRYDLLVDSVAPRVAPRLSLHEPLGTDAIGRSVTSRLVYGARQSILIGTLATVIAMLIGGPLGMIAGYFRGKLDEVITVVIDAMLSIPGLVLLLAIASVGKRDVTTIVIGLSIIAAPSFARLARANTLAVAQREFVQAARVMGARHSRIIVRELVPNVILPISSFAFVVMAYLIVAEGSLSFLGLGVPPPTPSWGAMINEGRVYLQDKPWLVLVPAACLVFTVLAFTVIGDRARRHFDTAGVDAVTQPMVMPAGTEKDTPLLVVEGLTTLFPAPEGVLHAVDDVSFTLARGETLGIVGESGSGKSVLCRTIMGIAPSTAATLGRVHFGEQDLRAMTPEQAREIWGDEIAMIFQDPSTALNPVIRVGRQITESLRLHRGLSQKEADARAVELLGDVGIPEPEQRLRNYPYELSGGMRQRVCIAIALACSPQLLFADEPTTALDVTIQRQILDLLVSLQRATGMAMVLITHDLGVVARRTDRIMVMYGGRIAELAPTRTLFREMRHPYTAALLASIPRLEEPSHTRLTVIPGRPPTVIDPKPGCRFVARCRHAQLRCLDEDPPLVSTDSSSGHSYACFYPVGTDEGETARATNLRAGRTAAGLELDRPEQVA